MPTRLENGGGANAEDKKAHEANVSSFDAGIDLLFGTSYARSKAPATPEKPRAGPQETSGMTLSSRKDDRRPGRRF